MSKKYTNNTLSQLARGFEANDWNPMLVMTRTGDSVLVTPCFEDVEPRRGETSVRPVYFLLETDRVNLVGEDTLAQVAAVIDGFDAILRESDRDMARLRDAYRNAMDRKSKGEDVSQDLSDLSDWHKDLYGHRNFADGLLAWSARMG